MKGPPLKSRKLTLRGGFLNTSKRSKGNQKLLGLMGEEYQLESAEDVKNILKDLASSFLEEDLKVDLDEYIDYVCGKKLLRLDTKNEYRSKTVKSTHGEIEINVTRDRSFTFFIIFNPTLYLHYD